MRYSFTSHIQYMCFTEKQQQQQKKTGPQNTTARITKSIHPRVVEGRTGSWEGQWHRDKNSIPISPGTGAGKCQKRATENPVVHSDSPVLKIHTLVSRRFCLKCTRNKIPIPQREGNTQRALGRAGPAFPGRGGDKEKSSYSLLPTPPIPSGWQATQWPAAAFSLAGDGCGEGNFSAEVELLRVDCRQTVLWKSLLLKKTTKEKRRSWKRLEGKRPSLLDPQLVKLNVLII